MDLAYGRWRGAGSSEPGPGRGVPRASFRCRRYLGAEFGANGASARRHAWQKSSLWEFWIPGCLSESSSRFRDYFRITRERFDLIYEAAADSGLFGLNPSEPLYSRIHPEGPDRPGHPSPGRQENWNLRFRQFFILLNKLLLKKLLLKIMKILDDARLEFTDGDIFKNLSTRTYRFSRPWLKKSVVHTNSK